LAAFPPSSPPAPTPQQLEQLANQARQLAAMGQLQAARQHWHLLLQLLPADSPSHASIEREIAKLDARMEAPLVPKPEPKAGWGQRLGPIGVGIAALLTKGKFLLSMLAFVGLYWAMFGWWFAVGLSGSVLIHEMGHYVVVRLFGLKAELPMFLPGLGAYVKWQGTDVSADVRAQISLAGPLFGFFSGLLAYGLYLTTHEQVWLAVAQFAGWMNLLNLTPVGMFDGGRAMDAIGKQQRVAILLLCGALAFVLHQWVFGAVAAGTGYRLWKQDVGDASERIGYYFIALVLANGLLSWYCVQALAVSGVRGF
jgi:Zn-dependent protease